MKNLRHKDLIYRATRPAAWIFLLILMIAGCRREESDSRLTDTKYVLSENDFFITGLRYRADSAAVVKAIGLPDSIKEIKQTRRFNHSGYSCWYYPDYQLYFNPVNTLDGILIQHSGFLTAKGLGVGDSFSRVRELYGDSSNDVNFPYASLHYCYNQRDTTGITIRIEDNRVKSIYAGRYN